MATFPRHCTVASAPHELEPLLGILEASDALAQAQRAVTPEAIARWCRQHTVSYPLSPDTLEKGLAALSHADQHLRTLIAQRRQLMQFSQTLEQRQRALDRDRVYTKKALQAVDAQLCDCGILAGKPAKRSLQ